MSNYSEIFLYATIYSNFKFIDFFELSCLHTHTHTHTHADEYFIVAVDIVPMTTADLVLSHRKCPRAPLVPNCGSLVVEKLITCAQLQTKQISERNQGYCNTFYPVSRDLKLCPMCKAKRLFSVHLVLLYVEYFNKLHGLT